MTLPNCMLRLRTSWRAVAAVALGLALLAPPPALAELSLKFGIYVSEKPTLLVRQFRPLLDYLQQTISEDLGETVRIEIDVSPSYREGIAALAGGQVDFARLGPASFLTARQTAPDIELLALESDGGDKYFNGVIFTRTDSGIDGLAGLKGKRFAFGDRNSTAGRYLSQYALLRAGVRAKDLAGYEYLGRHDRVADAVWRGEFAAGAVKEDVFLRLQKEGKPIKALTWMKNVTGPWAARAGLPLALSGALRRALLAAPEPLVTASIGKQGFLPYAPGDLDLVREAMQENGLFFR